MELKVKSRMKEEISEKVGLGEKVSYGFGNLAANLLLTTANTFITFFYTEISGIAVATVGIILLIARLLDGASDIAMGLIVDKTSTKHGKARPWLLWLAIPFAVAVVLLFTSPNLGSTGNIIYAFITYSLAVTVVFTAISVPYNTLSALITQNQNERSQLSIFRTAFGFLGAMLLSIITMPMVKYFGDGKQGWFITAVIYGIVAAVLYLICFKNTKERVVIASEKKVKVSAKAGVKALFKNKYWLIVISTILIAFIGAGLGGVNIYYAQYILGNSGYIGVIGTASFMPIVAGMVVIPPLIKKFGKRNLAMDGVIMSILGAAIMAISPDNLTVIIVGLVIKGLGAAPILVATFAMLGDTVEYGEWKSGVRAEGLTFSAGTFGEKVGTGLGGVILGAILGLGGYIGGQSTQSAAAISAIKVAFIYTPIILGFIQVILLYFYKLDKEYPQILAELKERNANR